MGAPLVISPRELFGDPAISRASGNQQAKKSPLDKRAKDHAWRIGGA
jgi:hypothetical protein